MVQSGKITVCSESSRHLNLALFLCFENKYFGVESWNIILNFSTFSVGDCWGQQILLFWKLIDKTQISKPLESASYRNSTKLLIFLPSEPFTFTRFTIRHPVDCNVELLALTRAKKIGWIYALNYEERTWFHGSMHQKQHLLSIYSFL